MLIKASLYPGIKANANLTQNLNKPSALIILTMLVNARYTVQLKLNQVFNNVNAKMRDTKRLK